MRSLSLPQQDSHALISRLRSGLKATAFGMWATKSRAARAAAAVLRSQAACQRPEVCPAVADGHESGRPSELRNEAVDAIIEPQFASVGEHHRRRGHGQ
jgi:hypothetical protein